MEIHLKRYKEEIDKPYSRIMFYLCSSSDYFDSVLGDFDLDSDSYESSEKTPEFPPIPSNSNGNNGMENQAQTNFVQSSTTSPSANQEQGEHRMAWSAVQEQLDLFEKDLQCPVFEIKPVAALTTEASVQSKEEEQERLMSCPICFSLHPIEHIKEHADNCSMWLLDDTNDQCDIPDPSTTLSCNAEPATVQVLTGYQQKKVLREQIAALSAQLLSTDVKRITIRKFMWQDFKSAMSTKIQPKSTLKVVFSGEPAVDDGGSRRESYFQVNDCSLCCLVIVMDI